jgi:hypothetical protein
MPRKYSYPLRLRPEARAAAFMLATVQGEGDPSHRQQGIKFWLRDLVDVTVCGSFQETFGVTIKQFLKRARRLKLVDDNQLAREAQLLADQQFAALGEQQGANRAGVRSRRRRRGRFIREELCR